MPVQTPCVRLHPADNVVVATTALARGVALESEGVVTRTPIPPGHKLATADIARGSPVRKFNQTIGVATADILAGEHVHTQNCGMTEFTRLAERTESWRVPSLGPRTFDGYRRENGTVGTRNYIGILTSVNCSGTVARSIADAVERSGMLAQFPTVDGIVPIVHNTGCGIPDSGEGYDTLQRTLSGYAKHPNFGAVLMVGLGCEVVQIASFKTAHGLQESPRFQTFTIQDSGGTRRAIEAGIARIQEILPIVAQAVRSPVPASEVALALQCGGSDGYSGITANPALGAAADLLVALGGTVILSETPEIYGAEHLLLGRAATAETAQKLRERLSWWRSYAERNGAELNNNPTPGNKLGGLTTILEKSLGAVAKGGTSPLQDVIRYAEPLTSRGLVFMDSPGFDPCSATGQVASGATVICFTTGRGSVFGCKPVPSLKLATNADLFRRMRDDMDVNCGDIIEDGTTIGTKGLEILQAVLAAASGQPTKSEQLGFGAAEFVPWQIGAVL